MQKVAREPGSDEHLFIKLLELLREKTGASGDLCRRIATIALDRVGSPLVIAFPIHVAPMRLNHPDARLVQDYATDTIMDELARHMHANGERSTRVLRDEEIVPLLEELVGLLFSRLDACLQSLVPEAVDAFVLYYELIVNALNKRRFEVPMLVARTQTDGGDHIGSARELSDAAGATRLLVEYAGARLPRGKRLPTYAIFDELLATGSLILHYGHLRNAHKARTTTVTGRIAPSLRPLFQIEQLAGAMEPVHRDMWFRELQDSNELIATALPDTPPTVPEGFAELDAAGRAEWGAGFIELGAMFDTVSQMAGGPVGVMPEAEFVSQLSERMGWTEEQTAEVAGSFTHVPRDRFLDGPETEPWRMGRRGSYLMRPFIRTLRNDTPHLTWGPLHVMGLQQYLVNLVLEARLKTAFSPQMKSYLGARRREFVRFNLIIKREFETPGARAQGWTAHDSVDILKIFNGPPELGDIDTLALHHPSRTAYLIEAKSIAVGRAPQEWRQEINKLFDDEKAAIPAQMRRIPWVESNFDLFKRRYNLDGDWNIRGVVVLDRPLVAAALRQSPFPILSLSELQEQILTGKLR